jgi:thymidylate kinase
MIILINGIPASGKTTYAQRLNLALEHLGFETVLLDDEVIKRLDTKKIDTLVDFIDSPITIIASCNPDIKSDISFWIQCPLRVAEERNNDRLEKENAPKLGNMESWINYQSYGIKIKEYEELCHELRQKNLKC